MNCKWMWNQSGRWKAVTIALTLVLSSGSFGGCSTWIGNPKQPESTSTPKTSGATVALSVVGSTSTLALVDTPPLTVTGKDGQVAGTLILSKAYVALKEIKLKKNSEDAALKSEFTGPFIVDLLNNTMTPEPPELKVAAGSYTEINLKLAKVEDEDCAALGSGQEMCSRSIYLEGSYTPTGGETKSFVMSFEFDEEFTLPTAANAAGVTLQKGEENSVVLVFGLDRWFNFAVQEGGEDAVDFSSISDSSIVLDDGSDDIREKLREIIKENIKNSGEYGRDDNSDGELEHDEIDSDEH